MTKEKEQAIYGVFGITPGPWEAGESKREQELMVYCDDVMGSRIADCVNECVHQPKVMKKSNANLIASAPSMLIKLWDFQSTVNELWEKMMLSHDIYGMSLKIGASLGTVKQQITDIYNSCTGKAWTFEQIAEAVDKECEG